GVPDLVHGVVAKSAGRCHAAGAPVGGVAGLLFEGPGQHGFDLVIADPAWSAAAGFVKEPGESAFDVAGAPLADGVVGDAQLGGNPTALDPVPAAQDDAGALGQAVARLGPFDPALEFGPILLGKFERSLVGTAAVHDVNLSVRPAGDPAIISCISLTGH